MDKIVSRESLLNRFDSSKKLFGNPDDRIKKPTLIDGEDLNRLVLMIFQQFKRLLTILVQKHVVNVFTCPKSVPKVYQKTVPRMYQFGTVLRLCICVLISHT